MIEYRFTIPGPPKGKQRARTGQGFSFTPKQTVQYENLVKTCFVNENPGYMVLQGPVEMHIKAVYPIAQSWPKKKTQSALDGLLRPTTKPDADNIVKIIADALNEIAYGDDKQIVDLRFRKEYGQPNVEVRIFEIC